MRPARRGTPALDVEVTNVSTHGFWLFIGDRELCVDFDAFPWFREAPIAKVLRVEMPSPQHLHWPDLDVDLAVDSIEHPERFPLVSRVRGGTATERPLRRVERRSRRSIRRRA